MLNLNLGSGTGRKQDFISVDLYTPEADLHYDLTEPLPYEDNSVDNLYACHVVEHFSREEWQRIAPDWQRILKPGGTLEIFCPHILKVAKKLLDDPSEPFVMMQLYGLQSNPGEYHKNGFTEESLAASFPDLEATVMPGTEDTELHMLFTKPAIDN